MTALDLTFPEEWATLPVRGGGPEAVRQLALGLHQVDASAERAIDSYLTALLPALEDLGIDAFASLAFPDEGSGGLVQAFCAVAVLKADTDDHDELWNVAEAGLHPGLERDTTAVSLPLGSAVRSSAFRFAEELLDEAGQAPYAFEVRFAFPLPQRRIGVLHFETLSLVYLEELEGLFDVIAGTIRVT
jgi:hypothetical protein